VLETGHQKKGLPVEQTTDPPGKDSTKEEKKGTKKLQAGESLQPPTSRPK